MSRDAFQIAESIAAGEPPDSVALEWFAAGLRKWGRGVPLEAALGLNHAGRVRRRDGELRAAAEALRAGRDISVWDLAGLLAARVNVFLAGKLALYWRGVDVTLDEVDQHLLAAALSGARMIESRKQLRRLLS